MTNALVRQEKSPGGSKHTGLCSEMGVMGDRELLSTTMSSWVCSVAGIPNLITADMIKEGAAVIDVGITRVQDPITAKSRLVGDVDFEGKKALTSHTLSIKHLAEKWGESWFTQWSRSYQS